MCGDKGTPDPSRCLTLKLSGRFLLGVPHRSPLGRNGAAQPVFGGSPEVPRPIFRTRSPFGHRTGNTILPRRVKRLTSHTRVTRDGVAQPKLTKPPCTTAHTGNLLAVKLTRSWMACRMRHSQTVLRCGKQCMGYRFEETRKLDSFGVGCRDVPLSQRLSRTCRVLAYR